MKKELYLDPHRSHIIIGDKRYIIGKAKYKIVDGIRHIDRYELEEVKLSDYDNVLDEIVKRVKNKVSIEKVLKEAFKKLAVNEREKLLKLLKSKKAKISEQEGCYGIVVGGKHFQIFE